MDYSIEKEIFSHLEGIINNAERMTSGNFMHNKAAIKLSANIVITRLKKLGLSSTCSSPPFWIARDKNGSLWLYREKPVLKDNEFLPDESINVPLLTIDDRLFPEVTFENSPKQVKFLLCEP